MSDDPVISILEEHVELAQVDMDRGDDDTSYWASISKQRHTEALAHYRKVKSELAEAKEANHNNVANWELQCDELKQQLAEAKDESRRLLAELFEAKAENERLRGENESLRLFKLEMTRERGL